MKLQTDIKHWEPLEIFKMFASRRNARQKNSRKMKKSNHFYKKRTKTKWSNKYLILKSVQKWNNLPFLIRTFNTKTCYKYVLFEFLLNQHMKVSLKRQIGAFNPILTYENEQPQL